MTAARPKDVFPSWFEDRATNVGEQADPSTRACLFSGPALVCARVAVLVVVVAVFALRHLHSWIDDQEDKSLCRSEGCAAMDALLTASANLSKDPCVTFTAYVCSGRWRNGADQPRESTAVTVLQQAWATRLHEVLEAQASSHRVIRKAANMFRACLSRRTNHVGRSALLLRQFLNDLHVTWPEEPDGGVEPLDLLLDCVINWGIPLWLRVRLMRYREDSPRQVAMDPIFRLPPMFEVDDDTMFGEMWLRYHDLLSSTTPVTSKPRALSVRQRIRETFTVQSHIVALVSSTGARWSFTGVEHGVSQAFTFDQIAKKTATFTKERLEAILSKHFKMIYPLVGTDVLVTSDVSYLDKAFDIFAEFNKNVLLDALGWWLVVSTGLYVPLPKRFDYVHNLTCAIHADDVYNLLLAAERATKLVSDDDRKFLEDFASRTVRNALDTSLSGFHSVHSRHEDAARLQGTSLSGRKVRVKLWPDINLISEKHLDTYFARFPEGGNGLYVEQWIYAKRNASALLSRYIYDELSRLPHFYYDPPIWYDLPHNTIVISPTALSEPLYFEDGTDAMLYGSLGSTLAMKAASLVGCKREAGCGYPAIFGSTAAWRYEQQTESRQLAACEQAGLDVAYEQYLNASSRHYGTNLESFPDHSPRQLFFMVWCYTRCFDGGFRFNENVCDRAVSELEAFQNAFDCKSTPS